MVRRDVGGQPRVLGGSQGIVRSGNGRLFVEKRKAAFWDIRKKEAEAREQLLAEYDAQSAEDDR